MCSLLPSHCICWWHGGERGDRKLQWYGRRQNRNPTTTRTLDCFWVLLWLTTGSKNHFRFRSKSQSRQSVPDFRFGDGSISRGEVGSQFSHFLETPRQQPTSNHWVHATMMKQPKACIPTYRWNGALCTFIQLSDIILSIIKTEPKIKKTHLDKTVNLFQKQLLRSCTFSYRTQYKKSNYVLVQQHNIWSTDGCILLRWKFRSRCITGRKDDSSTCWY